MRFIPTFLIWLMLALAAPVAVAVPPAKPAAEAPAVPADVLGRETPRSMVAGLIGALAELDYDRAAQFFDLPAPTSNRQQRTAASQARAFHALLDDSGSLKPFAALSNVDTGRLDDDLPADEENIGEVTLQGKEVPILLTRGQDGDRQVWRISKETLALMSTAIKLAPVAQAPPKNEWFVAGAPIKDLSLIHI